MSLLVDIQKDFGNFKLNVNFQTDNEVMGLLGASGCGKSMTLKCIAGIVTPDKGKIIVDDKVLFDSEKKINLSPQKRHVGLLFQNYALFPNMNVFQNIRAGIQRERLDNKLKDRTVKDIIEKFHLTGLEKRRPGQLSGGQQQRVALARILVSKPEILMLDEPFSALDSYLRWEVESELSGILEEYGKTVILVSHDRNEIYRLCKSACAISEGRAKNPVNVEQMFSHPQSISEALLSGCKNISAAKRISQHSILAEDWGLELWSHRKVPENLIGVGIQSGDLMAVKENAVKIKDKLIKINRAVDEKNEFTCRIERRIDDRSSYIYILVPTQRNCISKKRLRMDVQKNCAGGLEHSDKVNIKIDDNALMFFCE